MNKLLKENPNARAIVLFALLIYLGMFLSKTVHPIWFDLNDSILLFGVSYSFMAIAGYFSFFLGPVINRIGARKVILVGSLFYSLGLLLRSFPDSMAAAVVSGLTAGIGASATLVAMRPWILSWSPKDSLSEVVGSQATFTSVGTAMGCLMAGLVFILIPQAIEASRLAIVLSAVFPVLAGFSFFLLTKNQQDDREFDKVSLLDSFKLLKTKKRLAFSVAFLGVLTGFYLALSAPYIPLLLKENDFQLAHIGFVTFGLALLRSLFIPKITTKLKSESIDSKQLFFIAECLCAAVTFTLSAKLGIVVLLVILVFRSLAMAASALGEELSWLSIYRPQESALFFSLAQSCFFLGDALGGVTASAIYKNFGVQNLFAFSALLILVNAALTLMALRHFGTPSVKLKKCTA